MTLRLFWQIVALEARKRMSYRADFWLKAFGGLGAMVLISYFVVSAIFAESGRSEVGGFDLRGLLFYYLAMALIHRLVTGSELEQGIATDIYEGSLTRYVLYPLSYAPAKFAEQVGSVFPALVQSALFGLWMPWLFGWPEGVSAASLAMGAAAIALANVLHFFLSWSIQSVAFWADNVWSLVAANRFVSRILGGLLVPLDLFPGTLRQGLEFLPFRYLYQFPVDAVLGRLTAAQFAQGTAISLVWCGVLGAAAHLVWRRGLRQYTGVGI